MKKQKTTTTRITVAVGRKHGNQHPREVWNRRSRTAEQFDAVCRIVKSKPFLFAITANPFDERYARYDGPFNFAYMTRDETLHIVRIAMNGRVLLGCELPPNGKGRFAR